MQIIVSLVISALMVLGSVAYNSEQSKAVGASQSISSLTELTSLSHNDVLPITELSGLTTKKVKWGTATSTLKTIFDPLYSPIFSTSAELAGLLSDETGSSGGFVRAGSPSLTTPTMTSPVITLGSDATGDLYYRNAGVFSRLGIGATGQLLTASSTGLPEWRDFSATFSSLSVTGLATFSGTTTQATTTFSGTVTGVQNLTNQVTAQENITAGDAVVIGDGTTGITNTVSTGHATTYSVTTTNWKSQQITTTAGAVSIKSITFWASDNTGGETFTASVRANSAGSPTGSDIGGYTGTVLINGNGASKTITFSTPVPVSPSTIYHIIWRSSGAQGVLYGNNSAGTGANVSANSGSTWGASNGSLELSSVEFNTVSGQISKTTTQAQSNRSDNFIGFAVSAITAGNSGYVQNSGIVTGLSGLTPGSTYYLSDTYGAISSSAGTVSRKIGVALSATTLLIKHDNP